MKLNIATDIQVIKDEKLLNDLENELSYLLPLICDRVHNTHQLDFMSEFATVEKYLKAAEITLRKAEVNILRD